MQLNLTAPINQLGYGVAGLNILKALWNEGVETSLFPVGGKQSVQLTNQDDATIVHRSLHLAETAFDRDAPSVRIWHQNDLAQHVGKGLHIGFPIFELDTFTPQEKHHLASCDMLFVCSEWAKQVIIDQVPKMKKGAAWSDPLIHVVPLGVDDTVFRPTARVRNPNSPTVFFNCGKWEVRKGHDILVRAFRQAYTHNPNMELWMMCTNPFNTPEEENQWRKLYDHPAIKIIPRANTQQEVYNIMAQTDCGVFPSRAEGWNLELLEMMSVGRHVIATNYSAHTEFCNKNNSRLVDIRDKELAYDNKWFFGQGKWAKIDENTIFDLSLAMQSFAERDSQSINEDGIKTAQRFSWANSAKTIKNILGTKKG
jgi:glycosyltransferase involved in cell wall biosynthesis